MKTLSQLLSTGVFAGLLILSSCKKDDAPPPAPQVTPDKTSLAIVTDASDKVELTIVAPGKFSDVTATADQGTVIVSNITGTGTSTGGAEVSYIAPSAAGNYTITITAIDAGKQTSSITVGVAVTTKPPVNVPAGDVSGTWLKNTTYIAQGSLTVPAGQSLTIQEGVTVIFDGDGSQGSAEFVVKGNLYSIGTKDKPVLFTLPVAKRTTANIFAGLWGGVQATTTCTEMVLQYTNIEYAGAPAGAANVSQQAGIYTDGASRYGLAFTSNTGKLVMQNSRIAYTKDDGMRVLGGTVIITNNVYELCGSTGGEAINIKSGTTGDVAYNVIFSTATNGMKISNVSGTATTPQTNINTFNNTIINSGYRQTATSAHGGSINYEKGARGQIYNNAIVNCKFGTRITSDADYATNIYVGYNLYYGSESGISTQFYPGSGVIKSGDKETSHDLAGNSGDNDPKFVNFAVSTFASATAANTTGVNFMGTTDYHLQSASPALNKGKSGFTVGSSMTINGNTYTVPAPSSYIGAMPAN
ncbi:hypothetical protein WSM22_25820 [Cytophagales bacterium WSM2-2]|nr:hypothetical protein WSM22_25820 [Cytophagales bacterium WSM2-2]